VCLKLNRDGLDFIMRVSGNRRPRGGRSNSGNGRSGSSGGRGNSGNNRRSNNGNRSYDSNGPDGKIRGSSTQVYDKYISLGRDAQTSGDHVAAENYYQHAEHYYRIMLANNLVKLERPSDQDEDNPENGGTNEDGSANEAHEQSNDADVKSKDNSSQPKEENEQAPIIIDLSDPDGSDTSDGVAIDDAKSNSDNEAEAASDADAEEGETSDASASEDEGDEKPKSKRRVSRTRGLRRRTTRKKSADEESDEPQSA
jgi:hypothetical protein